MKKLEKNHSSDALEGVKTESQDLQMSFFNLDDPLLEEIKDEIFMLNINSIKGDIIFSYDVIRDENSSLYVASENSKVLLSYTPEEKEKNSDDFSNRFLYF